MFGSLGKLLGRAVNTVNNDVVQPVNRDVVQRFSPQNNPIARAVGTPIVNAWQTANPRSGLNQAKPFVQSAINQYQATPSFQSIIRAGHPAIAPMQANQELAAGAKAAAVTDVNNPVNQIQLGKGSGLTNGTIIHEALHRQWALNPADQQKFIQAYNQGATPELRHYLADRLQTYKEFQQGYKPAAGWTYGDVGNGVHGWRGPTGEPSALPNNQLTALAQAPSDIRNEVHSFIPEYYQRNHIPLTGALAQYYSQFFNPSFPQAKAPTQTAPHGGVLNSLKALLGHP